MEISVLPVGKAGSMVGVLQEYICSQVNPVVPRETLYPQLKNDSSNVQPPGNIKKDNIRNIFAPRKSPPSAE